MGDVSIDNELMRSARFRKQREKDWLRLETLLKRAQNRGIESFSFQEAQEFSALYRQAMNSLSLAREISLDRALLNYLQNLCARAFMGVYAPHDRVGNVIVRFFTTSGPQAVRRSWFAFVLATVFMLIGALSAWWLTSAEPDWYYSFVDGGFSNGRGPSASAEQLRNVIYPENDFRLSGLSEFSTRLFVHNTQVSIFSFSLGVMGGLPTAFLMFYNGTILGAFFAVHVSKGLGWDLFGWLSIHGVTELTAILLAAAGGFRMASAILFPGQFSRAQALRDVGHDAVKLAIIAAIMLLVAGLLEGFGRQLITDFQTRVIIGWGVGALWLAWFVFGGRKKSAGLE